VSEARSPLFGLFSTSRRTLIIASVIAVAIVVLVTQWNLIVLQPMLNFLIVLYSVLFHNFGLVIIVLTIIVRLLMLPLTQRQLHATKAMQELQPKMQELQKKYGKDRQRLAEEIGKLYRESGVSPMGCALPMVIQLPIWIALYQSIMRALATTPEDLLALSQHLYPWQVVHQVVPLEEHFLWLNLAYPDFTFILPLLVAATMWVQQKMMTTPTPDPRQQQMTRMMQWMMPIMFGLFALQFPSGLALYWVTMTVFGIINQYFVTGWGGLRRRPAPAVPVVEKKTPLKREAMVDEELGDKREVSGGGHPARPKAARSKSRRGKGHRPKKR